MNYTLKPNLSIKKVADELFVLNRETSEICSFNSTGAFIFECLQQGKPFEDIADQLTENFEVSIETAHKDLDGFLQLCADNKLLETTE
ncbi:MAG: PqqD family peptide modification chaperone [Chitinivibrionales bacterium]|nr:PqqD family peptide modification chaperone [Chitinivibrionales bacterium]